jgi:hypothetical protein
VFLTLNCNLNLKQIIALTLSNMPAAPYLALKYFSFTFTKQPRLERHPFQRHNLFGPFDDAVTVFDCICIAEKTFSANLPRILQEDGTFCVLRTTTSPHQTSKVRERVLSTSTYFLPFGFRCKYYKTKLRMYAYKCIIQKLHLLRTETFLHASTICL